MEGFRVTDRKLDWKLTNEEQNGNNEDVNELETLFNSDKEEEFSGFTEAELSFQRPTDIPSFLRYSQPKEAQLNHPVTKKMQKDFDTFNNKLINNVKNKKRKTNTFNLPKKAMAALNELKKLVKDKKIDIRKVDKGQIILIIDYEQRLKIEEKNILGIAERCPTQQSNWKENREYVEKEMKKLYFMNLISRDELGAVTGRLAGGADGKLKTQSGGIKFTRATDSNELFSQQKTPYIYPLLKAHKLPLDDLKKVKPEEVYHKIPARLVVGMGSCQLSRMQSWLEHLLTPFSKEYGIFEYTKDTNSILQSIDETNKKIE